MATLIVGQRFSSIWFGFIEVLRTCEVLGLCEVPAGLARIEEAFSACGDAGVSADAARPRRVMAAEDDRPGPASSLIGRRPRWLSGDPRSRRKGTEESAAIRRSPPRALGTYTPHRSFDSVHGHAAKRLDEP